MSKYQDALNDLYAGQEIFFESTRDNKDILQSLINSHTKMEQGVLDMIDGLKKLRFILTDDSIGNEAHIEVIDVTIKDLQSLLKENE